VNFTVIDAPQRSPAWATARLGRLTGSRASDMLATRKDGKEAAGRANLRVQLVLERLTGRCQESGYVSAAMQQGIDREVDACAVYEGLTGNILQTSGFLSHVGLMAGCSLDGHIGNFEGIIEVKSPIPATHLDYLKTGTIPGEYYKQIVHGLWISGARWCDWLSYNPDFPEPLRVKLVRVERIRAEIDSYELLVRQFLQDVDREYAALEAMAGAAV
jgi:YqaJ-like viral recombinase domain